MRRVYLKAARSAFSRAFNIMAIGSSWPSDSSSCSSQGIWPSSRGEERAQSVRKESWSQDASQLSRGCTGQVEHRKHQRLTGDEERGDGWVRGVHLIVGLPDGASCICALININPIGGFLRAACKLRVQSGCRRRCQHRSAKRSRRTARSMRGRGRRLLHAPMRHGRLLRHMLCR
jgi:hypothetical protein